MKRIFDVCVGLALLICLAPLFIVATVVVFFDLGRPIFFVQERPGKDKKIFKIVKFRTMHMDSGDRNTSNSDELRLTVLGRFLRYTSIDELPTLINVLKGDMSLVGPRPLLPEYLSLYTEFEARRHLVKPGITGWAQVNGRNAISWESKFELDIWYVENQSFLLDIRILALTVRKVLLADGVTAENHASMPKFKRDDN